MRYICISRNVVKWPVLHNNIGTRPNRAEQQNTVTTNVNKPAFHDIVS